MECKKCALNTIETLAAFAVFEDLTRFYSKAGLDDTSLAQIETLKTELRKRLEAAIATCELPPSSPIVKVKRDLDRATNAEGMLWAIQNFEGALYQSLKM